MIFSDTARKFFFKIFPFVERYNSLRQFVKFCIVGLTNASIDFLSYVVATRFFHIYFLLANVISFAIAVSWSFFWNRRWTFRNTITDPVTLKKQYSKFFFINIVGLAIQTLLLYWLVQHWHFNDLIVKAATIIVVAFWNFSLSKLWVFRVR